jgi:hypothetical protein
VLIGVGLKKSPEILNRAVYNEAPGRIGMHPVATRAQQVCIEGEAFAFGRAKPYTPGTPASMASTNSGMSRSKPVLRA